MWLVTFCHTEMAWELTAFRAMVSSTVESVLGNSPSNTAHTEVAGELAADFQKVEGHRSKIE
jgi:hypothetical protein